MRRRCRNVSIHATLAGGDRSLGILPSCPVRFYPRHPRGWRQRGSLTKKPNATRFYPRHPRGWRPKAPIFPKPRNQVSIHATLAGGDWTVCAASSRPKSFLSTPPSRVATRTDAGRPQVAEVSIHATLAGGDKAGSEADFTEWVVSIHATLAGGDVPEVDEDAEPITFLSTPPSRVATVAFTAVARLNSVSIHATLAGGDDYAQLKASYDERFYPRHPRGWRQLSGSGSSSFFAFLSTPPSRVATAKVYKNVQCLLRKKEKIICKIKNNLKHPPHIPIATSKKCTACPKTSDGIGAKLLGKVCLLSPRTGAATQAAHHPEQIRGGGQGAPRGFCSGCQAGKSAGCRFRGQSARPARL